MFHRYNDSQEAISLIGRRRRLYLTVQRLRQPAMSVPLHWSPKGLPFGVQFVAFGDEPTTLPYGGRSLRPRSPGRTADQRKRLFKADHQLRGASQFGQPRRTERLAGRSQSVEGLLHPLIGASGDPGPRRLVFGAGEDLALG